jgi:urease accessory protein
MPVNAGGLGYAAGFAAATLLLHAAGAGFGFAVAQFTGKVAPVAARVAGGLVAAAGVYLLAA